MLYSGVNYVITFH